MSVNGKILHGLTIDDLLLILKSQAGNCEGGVTLDAFKSEYLGYTKDLYSSSYIRSIRLSFNHLTNFRPGNTKLPSFDVREAEAFVKYLQRKAPAGYRVYFRTIKAAFTKAYDWGYTLENPFIKIKLPKQQTLKPVYIDEKTLKEICDQIKNTEIKRIVMFAFYTGFRLSEIINLKWRNVNIQREIIMLGDEFFTTKNKKQKIVPISKAVLKILNDIMKVRKPNRHEYVFQKLRGIRFQADNVSKTFKQAIRKLDLDERLHFHSLRHSFGSFLAQKGVSLHKIRDLMGHSSVQVTEIYAHQSLDSLRDALNYFN